MTGTTEIISDHPPGGYVFIVTYGRSGSTLLQALLNSIDGYCIRGENENVLLHLARIWHTVQASEPMRGLRSQGQTTSPTHPWFGAEAIDPEALGHAFARVFLEQVLKLPKGTRVGGFKEIRFVDTVSSLPQYLRFIFRFFPNSRIIFNVRDHAAVARSGWWANMDPKQVIPRLARADEKVIALQEKYPAQSIVVRYEDYTRSPDALLPLFQFLGEPFSRERVTEILSRPLTHLKTPSNRPDN